MTACIPVRIAKRRWATPSVVELVLESSSGTALPEASAGSHIDIKVGNGLVRQYSLVDPAPANSKRYRIGVKVERNGRGGSLLVAVHLHEGRLVEVGAPRNLFPLAKPSRRKVLLIAGGIGITAIHAMACDLRMSAHTDWQLHYAFSNQSEAYFPSEWMHDDEHVFLYESKPSQGAGRHLALQTLVDNAAAQGGADIYCCGPVTMLNELSEYCLGRSEIRYVQENFEAPDFTPDGTETAFDVKLARTGRVIHIDAHDTILGALRQSGIKVPFSCEQGICGECETTVLEGQPLHHDAILSPSEKSAGRSMMICCSRSKTSSLTLDL